jgi:hypothetical protein
MMNVALRHLSRALCVAVFVVVTAWSSLASAATYWVRTDGGAAHECVESATDPGAAHAESTIAAGVACLASGDTLNIQPGTYPEALHGTQVPSGGGSYATATIVQGVVPGAVILKPTSGSYVIGFGTDGSDHSYVIVRNLVADGGAGVQGNGVGAGGGGNGGSVHHITFENLEIKSDPSNAQLQLDNGMAIGGDDGTGTDITVRRVKIHDGGYRPSPGFGPGFGHCWYVEGPRTVIENSECYNWAGWGIHSTNGPAQGHNVYRFNTIHNVGTYDQHVAFAILLAVGVAGAPNDGNQVYGNLLVNNQEGISVTTNDNLVANNTVYGSGIGFGGACCYPAVLFEGTDTTGNVFKNNIVFGNQMNSVEAPGAIDLDEANNLIGDPLFVNAGAGDFHLQGGSPAIAAGTNLYAEGLIQDLDGHSMPPMGAFDLGALEYCAGGCTPPLGPDAATPEASAPGANDTASRGGTSAAAQSAKSPGGADAVKPGGAYLHDTDGDSGGCACQQTGKALRGHTAWVGAMALFLFWIVRRGDRRRDD